MVKNSADGGVAVQMKRVLSNGHWVEAAKKEGRKQGEGKRNK